MQDFRKIFISGIVWKFIFYLSTFVLNLLIANHLGAKESGSFFYLLNNISIAILFLSLGLDSSINYFNSKKEFDFSYLLSVGVLWSVCAVFFSVVLLFTLSLFHLIETSLSYYIVLYIFGSLLTSFISSLYYSSNKHILPNLLPAIGNLIIISYLLVNYTVDSKVPDALIKIYLLTGTVAGIFFLLFAIKKIDFRNLQYKFFERKIFRYSLQVFAANIFFALLLRSDIWIIKYLCSESDLGNYIQTAKLAQLIFFVPNLASFALFPLITQNIGAGKIEDKIIKLMNFYFYSSLLICIAFATTGHWLFPTLYGSSFFKMYFIFILFVPGLLSLVCSYPITPFFSGMNRNKVVTETAGLAIVIMLVADTILISYFSIYGAALGSSIAYSFYFCRLFLAFKKHKHFTWQRIFSLNEFYHNLRIPHRRQKIVTQNEYR